MGSSGTARGTCAAVASPVLKHLDAVIKFAQIGTKHRKSRKAFAALEHHLVPQPFLAHTRRRPC